MLKVECESCKAPYQVDERRVSASGLKMRCPKCGHTFLVTDPSKGPPPAEGAAPPKPAAKGKATIVGLAPKIPVPKPKAEAAPAAGPPDFGADLDLPLPAVKSAPQHKAPAPAAPAFPGLDDLDLPAVAPNVGLPAAVRGGKAPPPKAAAKPAPAPFSFDVDLPTVGGGAATPPAPDFGDIDLPAAKGVSGGFGDLPAAKKPPPAPLPSAKGSGGGFGEIDLPAAKGGGFGEVDLPNLKGGPSPRGGAPAASLGGGGFGEIDLPSVQNDLPIIGANANLPSPVGLSAHLPAKASLNAHLPSPMGADALLPSVMGAGAHLPSPTSPGAHLPSPTSPGAHLPMAMSPNAHLPAPAAPPPPQGGGLSFGELDLPLVEADAAPPPPAVGGGFGEVDLPLDALPSNPPVGPSSPPSGGGLGFGEVDLGGGDTDAGTPLGPPPATSAGTFAFQEASLEGPAAAEGPAIGTRAQPVPVTARSSALPKVAALALAIVIGGGAALQLTPLGAFGYVYLTDKAHAGDYLNDATTRGDEARKKLALDTFPSASQAADDLIEARRQAPRSRPLGAYAAFIEYEKQLRFGIDPARAAKVTTFLTDIPPDTEVPYLIAAQAAQAAQAGEWSKAKSALEQAIAKEPKNGIQNELSSLKGEMALAERDAATALAAFSAAHAGGASARTSFGIARAHFLANALTKARQAVDDTLKASPNHAGALTMRAELVWQMQRDDVAALKDLATVLDPKNKANLGGGELSSALSAKGWISFARDRAGEARAAFDEAVKVNPRNVSALVGQGEVLYADSRSTEALTRFEEALTKDPSNIAAIIGAAKAKIALERLADAKTQLTQARQKAPKDMNVALWLAHTEEALGNKKAAEDLYQAAIDLADPQDPAAVQPYAAMAKFLAAQGKNVEANAKLEQARAKLPDSAALQRAMGDVAEAQGQFEQALTNYKAALEKTPNDLGTKFRLGVTYQKMHKLDEAAKVLDEVAAVDKEYPGIALVRGMLFEDTGDLQRAIEQFQSASQKAPNDLDLSLRVGAAYVSIGEIEKAMPFLNKVKDARPNSAEANHFIGRAYLKQGGLDSAQAMRYLQRAVALDPNKAEYHLYVAWAANESTPAQLGLARTHIDKALALDKNLADAYWQRGVLERKEGQVIDAIRDLKRALELKPNRHEAHAALAEAYEDKNDMAGATAEWQRAIAGDDKQPYWRYKYGKILADRGHGGEAARHLAYAVDHGKSMQPRPGWLASAAFEAAEALRKSGQKKEACDQYRLFVELAPSTSPDMRDAKKALSDLACPADSQ